MSCSTASFSRLSSLVSRSLRKVAVEARWLLLLLVNSLQ
jgi:hypothetical protein